MTPDSPSFESKRVLTPQAMVELIFRLRGGTFTSVDDLQGIDDLITTMQFPTGADGKEAKRKASSEGIVLVQRGIAAVSTDARILLATRNEPHLVIRGGSILTSGSPDLTPSEVFQDKISLEPHPSPDQFRRIGFGQSSPEQTGGIHYFFDIHRLQLGAHDRIASLTKDTVSLVTPEEAEAALSGKPMELSLLKTLVA